MIKSIHAVPLVKIHCCPLCGVSFSERKIPTDDRDQNTDSTVIIIEFRGKEYQCHSDCLTAWQVAQKLLE